MITYNDLYEALRKEKYIPQLQLLTKNFFEDAAVYFKDKRAFGEKDGGDLFSDISMQNKKKLENAVALFKELLLLRRKKILNMAFVASETGVSKKDFENLVDFEGELFEDVTKSLEKAAKSLDGMMSGEKSDEKYTLVRFLDGVTEFLGLDGESHGPFAKGEVANLDREIVDILVKDKKVEVIEE